MIMTKIKPSFSDNRAALIKQAEKTLLSGSKPLSNILPQDKDQLVHELQTHQIELELQNGELRQAQIELNTSRKKFSDLYDFAPVGYLTISDKGLILEANLTTAQMLGVERGRLIKQAFSNFIFAEDQDSYYLSRIKLLDTKSSQTCELRMQRKCGTLFDAHFKMAICSDVDGSSGQFRVIMTDISERKKAEIEIKESESRFRGIFEQAAVGVARLAPDGSFLQANKKLCDIVGYTYEELLSKTFKDITHPDDLQADLGYVNQLLNDDIKSFSKEKRYCKKNGDFVWGNITVSLVRDTNNKTDYFIAIIEDITEKKNIFDELKQHKEHLEEQVMLRTKELQIAQQKAQAANMAKSSFLANMSHEIRTPMNAILGLTHLLRKTELNSFQLDQLKKISKAGDHLLSLINDILDLSKIEAGKIQLEQTNFNLETIFDNIQSLLAEQFKEKGLFFEIEEFDFPPWLKGDPTRLHQALLNYLSNAIKFTSRGKVTLRVKLLTEQEDKLLLRFEVQDTGMGLKPDKLKQLFKNFEQADSSTTRQYGGTGLGLSITKRIAQLMGGNIGVESEINQGSTFWFSALFHRGQEDLSISTSLSDKDLEITLRSHYAGAHILLVEDNAINLEVAQGILADVDIVVDTASNGQEALEKIETTDYALVLMDVQMPKMDGLEATRRIRTIAENANLPVLAMTAGVLDNEKQDCITAGMNDFVAKPIELNNLYSSLIKWLPKRLIPLDTPSRPVEKK
jgi:two-component system, sensor histidine kinase and response regulator